MEIWRIDATKFQTQLGEVATTIAYKVQREGTQRIGSRTATEDIYVLVRQAQRAYDLFFYLNAEEQRREPFWRAYYTFAALPVIRSMIDCLYNITAMLEDPRNKPAEFRKSGYKMALEALDEDERKYANNPDTRWAEWFSNDGTLLILEYDATDLSWTRLLRRRSGLHLARISAQGKTPLQLTINFS